MTRILLIEDNDINRDLISRYLEHFGFEVKTAADGLEGLSKARIDRDSIDVAVSDLSLPGIDGWELARRLKADPVTRDLPLIALTAHAMIGDREAAIAAGFDDYATKPVDFSRLIDAIDSLTRKALQV